MAMELRISHRVSMARLGVWVIIIESLLHLVNYSDPVCIVLLALSQLIGVFILYQGSIYRPTALLCAYFLMRYLGIASILKIGLGQSLQSNLYHPRESFLMNFVVCAELLAAYMLVAKVRVRKPLLAQAGRDIELAVFSYVCLAIGTVAMFFMARQIKADPEFGGFFMFSDSIYTMGIIARLLYLLKQTNNRKVIDPVLAFMLALTIGFAFISGTKFVAFNCVVAYAVTLLCIRRSLPVWLVASGVTGFLVLVMVVAPVINYLRETQDMNQKNLTEKLEVLTDFFTNRSIFESINEYAADQDPTGHYQHYFGAVGVFNPVTDRVGMIQNGDALMTGLDNNGYMGWYLITEGFTRVVPRVIYPDKDSVATCDYIVWHAGARPTSSIGYPTVGIIGGSYAVCGWIGVLFIPFVLFTMFFALLKWLSNDSPTNIWAIYLFVNYSHKLAECDVTPFINLFDRNVPLDIGLLYVLFVFSRYLTAVLVPRRNRTTTPIVA